MLSKRGQLAITVIVAIIIVAVIAIFFFVFPQTNVFVQDVNPSSFLSNCIESDLQDVKQVLSAQGGYANPSNYVSYEDGKIQYLCYTSEDYIPCVVQQPLLVNHVESEIENFVQPRARQCVTDLAEQYEKQGFEVRTTPGEVEVDIVSGSIIVEFLSPMTITKETTQSFEKFAISIDSEWYDLLITAVSITQFESTFGDSETTLYLQYYPDLKIEKIRRDDGDKIYRLSNVITEEEFTFASRSLVFPSGYGVEDL